MILLHDCWILFVLFSLQSVAGVQVTVKDEKKFSMLFSSVVLPCHYTTHSTQTAVVQWWYKSYCKDRTRDSFTYSETLGVHVSDLGVTSYLDCSDKSRTVRVVASAQGSSVTLAEYYKERDISIINKADLRIGQLQWGDSGVYSCKVIISDDLEGVNEDQVELLVQDPPANITSPSANETETLSLHSVASSSDTQPSDSDGPFLSPKRARSVDHSQEAKEVLQDFELLFGVETASKLLEKWDSCLKQKVIQEAKALTQSLHLSCLIQLAELQCNTSHGATGRTGVLDDILPEFDLEIMPEWVFVGAVVIGSILFLLLVGICWCQCCPHSCCCYVRCCCCPDTCCCPKHLYEAGKMAKSTPAPQIAMYQPYYVPGVSVVSSVAPSLIDPKLTVVPSSVDNNITGVRSGYRLLQASQGQDAMKVVYYIERDLAHFNPTKGASHSSGSLSELSSLHDADVDFRHTYRQIQRKALTPISDHSEDPRLRTASTRQGLRPSHYQSNPSLDEHDSRWNCRSEYLPRKAFDSRGRTGSLDELEEFAMSYGPHGRRKGEGPQRDFRGPQRDIEMAQRSRDHHTSYRNGPRCSRDDDDDDWHRRASPPSPPKRRATGDSERYAPRQRSYDDTYLNSLLERKARGHGERGGRGDDDSDTPSKGSSRKSNDCYQSRSPSNRPEEDEQLPPYCEREAERFRNERYRTADPAMRPFSYTRPANGPSHTLQERREERDKPRKLTTHLSRDSLIV